MAVRAAALLLAAHGAALSHAVSIPPVGAPIPALNVDGAAGLTVSGLSAGACMAVQTSVGFSSIVKGAAVFSGQIWRCELESCFENCSHAKTNSHCHNPESEWDGGVTVADYVNLTHFAAGKGLIDDPSHMKDGRYYFFRGLSDKTYKEGAVNATLKFFSNFAKGENIHDAVDSLDAAHTIPTLSYGNPCTQQGKPCINNCNYDGAGSALQWLYADKLSKRVAAKPASLTQFDQTPYISAKSKMADFGVAYIPAACRATALTSSPATCRLHFHFHGTNMNIAGCHLLYGQWVCEHDSYGRNVSTPDSAHSGFNEWAEANNIVVVYPQTSDSAWDVHGGSGDSYAWKTSHQMTAMRRIMDAWLQLEGGGIHGSPLYV